MTSAQVFRSALLTQHSFRHAFFGRGGGVSEGPYSSLNFSVSVGDAHSRVERNFALAAEVLGVPVGAVPVLSQVHGVLVHELRELVTYEPHLEGDGLVSGNSTLACGVRTADCVPILIGDTKSGRVAALHAGWRGVAANIVAVGVLKLGGNPRHLVAAIGPHISEAAFEIGRDVAEQLACCSSNTGAVQFTDNGKARANLRSICRAQLRDAGLLDEHIDDVWGCTYSEPENFFSFRRDGAVGGRHLSAIRPRAA
jgi:YfiH family protein